MTIILRDWTSQNFRWTHGAEISSTRVSSVFRGAESHREPRLFFFVSGAVRRKRSGFHGDVANEGPRTMVINGERSCNSRVSPLFQKHMRENTACAASQAHGWSYFYTWVPGSFELSIPSILAGSIFTDADVPNSHWLG